MDNEAELGQMLRKMAKAHTRKNIVKTHVMVGFSLTGINEYEFLRRKMQISSIFELKLIKIPYIQKILCIQKTHQIRKQKICTQQEFDSLIPNPNVNSGFKF
jgi:hypothetical protein